MLALAFRFSAPVAGRVVLFVSFSAMLDVANVDIVILVILRFYLVHVAW